MHAQFFFFKSSLLVACLLAHFLTAESKDAHERHATRLSTCLTVAFAQSFAPQGMSNSSVYTQGLLCKRYLELRFRP